MPFEWKALAVKRIITNNGNKTPGIGEIDWVDNNKKYKAIQSIYITKSQKRQR